MVTRISPPPSLIDGDPFTVVVSNNRPVQAYSSRVLRLFKRDNATTVKLTALGGAIPTAQRIARYCIKNLQDKAGWSLKSESVLSPYTKSSPNLEGDGFGQVAGDLQEPTYTLINAVVITITRTS
jgi:Alba